MDESTSESISTEPKTDHGKHLRERALHKSKDPALREEIDERARWATQKAKEVVDQLSNKRPYIGPRQRQSALRYIGRLRKNWLDDSGHRGRPGEVLARISGLTGVEFTDLVDPDKNPDELLSPNNIQRPNIQE